MEQINGYDERGYAVSWCVRGKCRRHGKMETGDPLWQPLKEKLKEEEEQVIYSLLKNS